MQVARHARHAYMPLAVLVLLLGACGPSANQKALQGTLITLNGARDGFTTWDQGHQQLIVTNALSLVDGQKSLATYRAFREKVVLGFEVAYRSLAFAALDPTNTNLATVLSAVLDVEQHVEALGATWVKGKP